MKKTNNLTEILIDLGLSENEAGVYCMALSLGPTTILHIAEGSGIKRTTIYSVVESLKTKGLMHEESKGFKKLYVAENPEKLEAMLEVRRTKLKNVLPEFAALYNLKGSESFLKYYEGKAGMRTVYANLLQELKSGDEYLVLASQDCWLLLDEEFFSDYRNKRRKLHWHTRMILEDTKAARAIKSVEQAHGGQVKFMSVPIGQRSNLVITPTKVIIQQLIKPIVAIIIENKNVVELHRDMFDLIWKGLPA